MRRRPPAALQAFLALVAALVVLVVSGERTAAQDTGEFELTVVASGTHGGEVISILVDGTSVGTATLATTATSSVISTDEVGLVEVTFLSAPTEPHQVEVDAVVIGGVAHQAEDPSTTVLANGTACAEGQLETELLLCVGTSMQFEEPIVPYLDGGEQPLEEIECGGAPVVDPRNSLIGSWIQEDADPSVSGEVEAVETLLGADIEMIRRFTTWNPNPIQVFPRPEDLQNRDAGRIIHLSIKPADRWANIAAATPGSSLYAEAYEWGRVICDFGAPLYLTFHHEPEGADDRAAFGEPADFQAAFTAMHDLFDYKNVSNVSWVWAMTWFSFELDGTGDPRDPDLYYPGPLVTDVIGFDPYNFYDCGGGTTWQTWNDVSQPFLDWLDTTAPSVPLLVPEFGTMADPNQPNRRAEWIAEAAADFNTASWDNLLGVAYFNRDGSFGDGCDWQLDGDPAALNSWREMAESPRFAASKFSPDAPSPLDPADAETGVSLSPTLHASVSDPDGDSLDVTFYGREVGATGDPFTFVTLPDTQHYVDDATDQQIFGAQTQWVADDPLGLDIALVSHLGDIVENWNSTTEWGYASTHLSTLDGDKVPIAIAPGNHDLNLLTGEATFYDTNIKPADFQDFDWYGGYLGENLFGPDPVDRLWKNNFELFSAGGMDFVSIAIEYGLPQNALDWAATVLEAYPDRQAIISTHSFLNTSAARPTTTSPAVANTGATSAQHAWDTLIKNHCNVFMVLNGHFPGEASLTSTNDCGDPVHQLLADYQSRANGGDGWLRYMTFDPGSDEIDVFTYSPTRNAGAGDYEDDSDSEFTLPFDMAASGFEIIGTDTVGSGSTASVSWPDRDEETEYEWYAVAHDGVAETRSATSTFTTGLGSSGLTVLGGPCVVYDSVSAGELPFVGGETRTVQVTGALTGQGGAGSCVPVGASSVVFGISSIDPLTEGNLLLTPAGVTATGSAGVVNYGAVNGLDNANTVTVPVSASGAVDIGANTGPAGAVPTTDVRLVVIGFYSPDVDPDLKFFAVNPCPVADSRVNQGASDAFNGPADDGLWPVGSAFPDIDVVGVFPAGQGGGATTCGVPESADAVMVNVVAVNMEGGSGHLSVGTGGADPVDEATTPFAVLTPKMNNGATTIINLGPGGTVAIDVDGDVGASTMIRVEVLGYYDNDVAGLDFYDLAPCAVFDTRTNQGATGSFAGERLHGPTNTTTYQIAGNSVPVGQGGVVDTGGGTGTCGVPTNAEAVLINLEAVNALREGNFWVSAAGTTTTGGVLNFNNVVPKMNNANAVVVPLSANGELDLEINAGSFTPVGTSVAHARGVILGYYN